MRYHRLQLLLALASAAPQTTRAQDLPSIEINLRPVFAGPDLAFLNTTLRISDPSITAANQTLLQFQLGQHLSPAQRYDDDGLVAADDDGDLPISYVDDPSADRRQWTLGRTPVGDVTVRFAAQPRGEVSGIAGRSDLRSDQGGAVGQGYSFLPYPPGTQEWNTTVSWTLGDDAPDGTRFASSLGDSETGSSSSSSSSATGRPDQLIHTTYFAAGQLQRWPAWTEEAGDPATSDFAMYWIGDLPWDAPALASSTETLYRGTARYFSDAESDFRVFLRRDPSAFGGAGGYKSFLMEYAVGSEEESPAAATENLISHEIVHGFALTNPSSEFDKWYTEGVAEYLAAVGPFAGGTLDRATFVRWLNDNAQDYYTASPLGRTWESLVTDYWTQGTSVVKAPYTRGFMYLAQVQGLIADATDNGKSLDDIITELERRYRAGQEVTTEQFLSLLGDIVGADVARDSFDAMANGTTIFPSPTGFGVHGLKMVRRDLEAFSLGMGEGSLGLGKVTNLTEGSRAAEAGLREGDVIVSNWGVWGSTDTLNSTMRVVVERDGGDEVIEYWPRSRDTVEAWEWVDV
ncbi:hypothetical protein N3K66_007764 [Trichothecium roseum]|uniref:Uncharacterized protein n=1 Tax=Trichothecium roseum TaxID=47278 RepID=A0ACC0UV98_9HYPO|nr:hypothetical protein N3K66_007764 [Trichothecium roseum]